MGALLGKVLKTKNNQVNQAALYGLLSDSSAHDDQADSPAHCGVHTTARVFDRCEHMLVVGTGAQCTAGVEVDHRLDQGRQSSWLL